MEYLTPAEASARLGISRATITRCKQRGAPVHYFGTCGRIYRIDPAELLAWMNEQGGREEEKKSSVSRLSLVEMRAARHRMVNSKGL